MSETSEQTKIYHQRRIETLVDDNRYETCDLSRKTILRFVNHHGFSKGTGRHLDLGCGDKALCKTFQDNGWVSVGIDISDGVDFETDAIPMDDKSVDLITLYGVIEHIANPHIILSETLRVLDYGGVCVMVTPNVVVEGMTFFDDPDHKKPYTPKGLNWLMNMYGFQACAVGLWTVNKPSVIWSLPIYVQFFIGRLIPFYGRNNYAPEFLKGRSKTMIGSFFKLK